MNNRAPPSWENPTDLSLLERVKAGLPAAWEQLVERYGPLVYFWCRRSALGREDTADIFQEVFLAVSRHLGRFHRDDKSGTFRGWLRTITANKVRDLLRRRHGRPEAPGGSSNQARLQAMPAEGPESTSSASGAGAPAAVLHRALASLRADFDERTWQAFWRTTVEQQSSGEAAAALGMTANAVRKAKARVLGRLRSEMRGLLD